MTQTRKKRSKPEAAETIIDSAEGKLTFLERSMLDWRDRGLLDDPYNLIGVSLDGDRPRLDIMADTLNWLEQINDAQRSFSARNNTEKPSGGYYKVKRGHLWRLKRYPDTIKLHQELSGPQMAMLLSIEAKAKELKEANKDPAQLNAGPTSMARLVADNVYRRHGLPHRSRHYAIKIGDDPKDKNSWVPENSIDWLALGLPDPNRKVVNHFLLIEQARLGIHPPEGVTVFEAHQIPEQFGFEVDSVVSAAADVHEAALAVEQLEFGFPKPSFASIVIHSMALQDKCGILRDIISKADPTDPKSLTISESVELGTKQAKENIARGKKTGEKNKEDKETKKEFVLGILQEALASRTFTKVQAIDLVRGEWRSKCKFKPSDLPHRTAERYIDELRRSGLIPGWK